MDKIKLFLLIGIILLAFILRFNKLGQVPNGLYQDETAIGYNAYSILLTGKDEHNITFPFYFKSFGDYKLPVYIYLTVISEILFGLTSFAVRFPSAFFGFLTVIISHFLVKELTKDDILSLVFTFLLAINPWSLHYNRATFEVSICLFLFILGTYLLHLALRKKISGTFFFGTICFILATYTYNLTRLLAPLLYILVLLFFGRKKSSYFKKEVIITVLGALILFIPFIKTFFERGGITSAQGTLIFSSAAVQAPLLEIKSYFIDYHPLISKIFFNIPLLTAWQYIQNVASYFSVSFFFVTGSTHGNHGIGNVGEFYLFELPLTIIGIYQLILKKYSWRNFVFLWAVITIAVASLTRDIPQATRSFFLIFPIELFSAVGFLFVFRKVKEVKRRNIQYLLFFILTVFAVYNISYYLFSYYVRFPILYAREWRTGDRDLSLYLQQNSQKYDRIIFDTNAGFIYSSLLFYTAYPPRKFQQETVWSPDDSEGFSFPTSFGKYTFKDIDWTKDYHLPHTLLVTTPDRKPNKIPPLKSFYYPLRPVAFAVKQEIVSYPVADISYVLVESK